jgi:transposase InsO family protein
MMGLSRSGYYGWIKRPDEEKRCFRARVLKAVKEVHASHPSHGYRWVHAYLKRHHDIHVSANYIYKAFCFLAIESKTKHKARTNSSRKAKRSYPNLILDTWEAIDRPWQVIVSDMTAFWTKWNYWELTLYFDAFTKQIRGRGLSCKRGDRSTYWQGLDEVIGNLAVEIDDLGEILTKLGRDGTVDPVMLHTDQGSVYASCAYNDLIKDENITRSMARVGKPTDNPICESLNGWIKEELFIDFDLYHAADVAQTIDDYIKFYNSCRPSYSLGYETPDGFYGRFMAGEIDGGETFKDRILDETPKFVKKRLSDSSQNKEPKGDPSVHFQSKENDS